MLVVPVFENIVVRNDMLRNGASCPEWNIGEEFFALYFRSRKPYNWFLAISSFGNIVVTTFTAARGTSCPAVYCLARRLTTSSQTRDC